MSGYVPNIPRETREAELRETRATTTDSRRQFMDAYEQHTAHLDERPAKTQVTLRIGVFFDGTGNNASNTLLGQQCGAHGEVPTEEFSAACEPYMSDPDSSYGNDVTNVQKLWDLYPDDEKPKDGDERPTAYRRVYMDGIGTRAGQEDGMIGMGLGRGNTGVEARVTEAFDKVTYSVLSFFRTNPDQQLAGLCLDVFGFSRGAAAARHFANELSRGAQGPLGQVFSLGRSALSPTFIPKFGHDVRATFIGLLDTVAAVAGWSDFGNVKDAINPGVRLYLDPGQFPHVVQLVARDEYRANFALNSVGPDHTELILPGVHSDIGGGYLPLADEKVLISRMRGLVGDQGFDVTATTTYQQLVAERDRWLAKGWREHELQLISTKPSPVSPPVTDGPVEPTKEQVFIGLQLRRQVRGELSRVYLRVMHQMAQAQGVPFKTLDESDLALAIPDELQPLCQRFLAGDYSTSAAEETLLRRSYIHTSAHWNPLPAVKVHGRTRLLYVHAPTDDGRRVTHPHKPQRSWL